MISWYEDNGNSGGGGGGLGGGNSTYLASFTPPVNSQFSWLNQGANGNIDLSDSGSIYLFDEGGQGNNYFIQARILPVPTGNYTAECAFIPQFTMATASTFGLMGMILYQSGSTLATFDIKRNYNGPVFLYNSNIWTNSITLSGQIQADQEFHNTTVQWMRIVNNGVNRIYQTSIDGKTFQDWYYESVASGYLNPTHIGFHINNYGALGPTSTTYELGMRLLHWRIF